MWKFFLLVMYLENFSASQIQLLAQINYGAKPYHRGVDYVCGIFFLFWLCIWNVFPFLIMYLIFFLFWLCTWNLFLFWIYTWFFLFLLCIWKISRFDYVFKMLGAPGSLWGPVRGRFWNQVILDNIKKYRFFKAKKRGCFVRFTKMRWN